MCAYERSIETPAVPEPLAEPKKIQRTGEGEDVGGMCAAIITRASKP